VAARTRPGDSLWSGAITSTAVSAWFWFLPELLWRPFLLSAPRSGARDGGERIQRLADDAGQRRCGPCPINRVVGLSFAQASIGDRRCLDCHHQTEPDPAVMAERYGAETPVPDWHARLVCGRCSSRRADMVVTGTERRGA
jgi:hypothetical protein